MGKCKSCDYWHKDEPQFIYGMCHRYPPQPDMAVSMKPGRYGEGGEVSIMRRAEPSFPNTHEDSWCGEYRFTRKVLTLTP